MPSRSFSEDAAVATVTAAPVPRGIAFQYRPGRGGEPALQEARAAVAPVLPEWKVREVAGLPGWFEAVAPSVTVPSFAQEPKAASQPLPLADFLERLRALRSLPEIPRAEPLLLVAAPQLATEVDAEAFAMGYGQEQFGLWGLPHDHETEARKARLGKVSDWHLTQLRARAAWDLWLARHPGRSPGDGVLIGHPDTGYSDHLEVAGRFRLPGRNFLGEADDPLPGDDGRDDLARVGRGFLQFPGHGTATASVIASGREDQTIPDRVEAFGVAPGARVLPLRVSRSVVHFDFGNVARAILHAVASGADVLSMSLGGPVYTGFIRDAIRQAHEQGVIVVAAAGNFVPATVFPAALPEVIGVAATNAADVPWRFSGIGRLVDIAAPGEGVWCADPTRSEDGATRYWVRQGDGTSFGTACVAGCAALWLSYHGGRETIARAYRGRKGLVPFAFQYLLSRTANNTFEFARKGRHGAGIADAEALLRAPLPPQAEVERYKLVIEAQPVSRLTFISGLFSGGMGVTGGTAAALTADATVDENGRLRGSPVEDSDAVRRARKEHEAEEEQLRMLLGDETEDLAEELLARIAADRELLIRFQRWRQGESALPLLTRLLGPEPAPGEAIETGWLSPALRAGLEARRQAEKERLTRLHRGRLIPGVEGGPGAASRVPHEIELGTRLPRSARRGGRTHSIALPGTPAKPAHRRLRAYAFDPSLETSLETAPIHQVTVPTPWEELQPGPVGEYLEVVDVDPASGCVYSPVDLNHPHILAQEGLPPSDGNPQFHQQMVYAVAMNTIHRFELALGRPLFWSPLRPWLEARPDERHAFTPEAIAMMRLSADDAAIPRWALGQDRYVQRLRIYPHALREANAYYSPKKRALLFGYFPAVGNDTGEHYPGGMVFTCLSHDIIVHETTHALLDGMHPYFNEPSNDDVWAFHEAFADIIALFQHFTYPEVLRHQIANTRGDLRTENLLGELAQEFGRATGGHGALRSALGTRNKETGRWERLTPDPRRIRGVFQPHARGSILVTAVFDAFLALYNDRVADLLRLYTGGTGVLPAGSIHPELVNRLAMEAAATAEEVLRVCIRAMDAVPPVDITFGEFLRALITADYDLSPTGRRTRIAFIDAFRSWGIYPSDVPSLSEESLRWHPPGEDAPLRSLDQGGQVKREFQAALSQLTPALYEWQPGRPRAVIFERIRSAQRLLHNLLVRLQSSTPSGPGEPLLPGLDLREGARFSVANLRPARRIGPFGEFRNEMVVEVVQTYRPEGSASPTEIPYRGGATLVLDLGTWEIRYIIYKRLYERLPETPGPGGLPTNRLARQQEFEARRSRGDVGPALAGWMGEDSGSLAEWLAETYACRERKAQRRRKRTETEPFALLHRSFK